MSIDTTKLRELAKMTPEQNTDYERLKQAAASVWFAGNMYIGPSMRELMRFFGEYKRLSPEYEQPATAPAGYKVVPDALRKLCKSAAPGPWYTSAPSEHAVWYDIKDGRYLIADTSSGFTDDGNAEYIAAANPATVLVLLDELDRLNEYLDDAGHCLVHQAHTIDRLMQIEKAARNLAKVKGRHNSEIAMNQLLDALK